MFEIFLQSKEWIFGIFGSVIMFFVGKNMRKINEESGKLDNLEKLRGLIEKSVDDQIKSREGLTDIIARHEQFIEKQRKTIEEQRKIIEEQSKFIEEQKKIITRQEKQLLKYKQI